MSDRLPGHMRQREMTTRRSQNNNNHHHHHDNNIGHGFVPRGRGYSHGTFNSAHDINSKRSLNIHGRRLMGDPAAAAAAPPPGSAGLRYRSRSPLSSGARSVSPPLSHSSQLRRQPPRSAAAAADGSSGRGRSRRPVSPPPAVARGLGAAGGGGRAGSRSPPPLRSRSVSPAAGRLSSETFRGPWGTVISRDDMKKITVDIKRHIHKEKRSSSPIIRRIISADAISVYRRSGEGARPLFARAELAGAVNRRFDSGAVAASTEPRVVAIIRDPVRQTDMLAPSPLPHATRPRSPDHPPHHHQHRHHRQQQQQQNPGTVDDYYEQERSAGFFANAGPQQQQQLVDVATLKQLEDEMAGPRGHLIQDALDRKLQQFQRYEQKFKETISSDYLSECHDVGDPMRKMVEKDVRQRLGYKRVPKDDRFESNRRMYDSPEARNSRRLDWHEGGDRRANADFKNRDRFNREGFRGRGRGRGYQVW